MSKLDREIWESTPIKPAHALASLRETVISRSEKRLPKWKFRLASDLVVRIQPKLTARTLHRFECMAVACEGATGAMLSASPRKEMSGQFITINFDVTAEHGSWVLKAKYVRRGAPRSTNEEVFALRDRLVSAFEAGKFDALSPAMMLGRSCLYCGKALTDPVSQARMIGPECAGTSSVYIPGVRDLQPESCTTPNPVETTMKAYHIDVAEQTITAVEYKTLRDLQELVGGSIEYARSWRDGTTLYVDGNGLMKPIHAAFRISGSHWPLASNGVVVGCEVPTEDDSRATLPPGITLEDLRAEVTFMTGPEIRRWALANANEPALIIDGRVVERVGTVFGSGD